MVSKCSWTHDSLSRYKKGIVTPWDRQKFWPEENCLDWGTQELGSKESGKSPNRVHKFISCWISGEILGPSSQWDEFDSRTRCQYAGSHMVCPKGLIARRRMRKWVTLYNNKLRASPPRRSLWVSSCSGFESLALHQILRQHLVRWVDGNRAMSQSAWSSTMKTKRGNTAGSPATLLTKTQCVDTMRSVRGYGRKSVQ